MTKTKSTTPAAAPALDQNALVLKKQRERAARVLLKRRRIKSGQ